MNVVDKTPEPKMRSARRKRNALLAAGMLPAVVLAGFVLQPHPRPVSSSSAAPQARAARSEPKILYWHDPMHPQYKSHEPGKAPDCGMDLVPVYQQAPASTDFPEGAFQISPSKQQLIGVQYGEVKLEPLSHTIRAVGRFSYDERRIVHVHARISGWLERIHADFTGARVEKGQPLVDIYSPDLVATQEEYLLALKAQDRLGGSELDGVAAGARSLVAAAARRLELWDVTDAQIEELVRTRKPARALTLHSPATGFVIARTAYERLRVSPETELFTIADLRTIWAMADIYEHEAPLVQVGQEAVVSLPYSPGRAFRGKVAYIYPQLESSTRTLKARIELDNPDLALRPDMYADVELRIDRGRQISIPQEAVLDSGAEQTVFVALERGYFEPRRVRLGGKVGDRYIVVAGLRPGERVVTSGNFLVDSESRLKSAVNGMRMPGMQNNDRPDHSKHGAAPEAHRHD